MSWKHEPEKRVVELENVLDDVRELLEDYVDVVDGDYGIPAANKAMRAIQLIDEALGNKP